MKKFLSLTIRRIREIAFIVISFPVAIAYFVYGSFGIGLAFAFPIALIAAPIFLSSMEYFAKYEIKRINAMLKTSLQPKQQWFTTEFFSWPGFRERVFSLKAWSAVLYIFIFFGLALYTFVALVVSAAAISAAVIGLGVFTLSSFSHTFNFNDNGDIYRGNISYISESHQFKMIFGGTSDSAFINWNLGNIWSLIIGVVIVILAAYSLPRNARFIVSQADGLLAGGYWQTIESKFKSEIRKHKKQSSEVEMAISSPANVEKLKTLSAREREILELMATGKSNAGIARELYITEASVEKHVSNILYKLDLPVSADSNRRILAVLKYLDLNNPESGISNSSNDDEN